MHRNYFGIKGSDPRIARNGMQRKNGMPGVPIRQFAKSVLDPTSYQSQFNTTGMSGVGSSIIDGPGSYSPIPASPPSGGVMQEKMSGAIGLGLGAQSRIGSLPLSLQQKSIASPSTIEDPFTNKKPILSGAIRETGPGVDIRTSREPSLGAQLAGAGAGALSNVLEAFPGKANSERFIGNYSNLKEQNIAREAIEGQRRAEDTARTVTNIAATGLSIIPGIGPILGGATKLLGTGLIKLGVFRNKDKEREAEARIAALRQENTLREIAARNRQDVIDENLFTQSIA